MKAEVGGQALRLAAAVLCGLGLGLGYDLGRSFRRTFPATGLPMDLLFAGMVFLTLWATSIYAGGLRIYQLLGMLFGAGGYFFALSRWVLGIFCRFLACFNRLFSKFYDLMKKSLIFLRKLAKKSFHSGAKWGTITGIPFSPKGRRSRREPR
jgi:hypothetical protein